MKIAVALHLFNLVALEEFKAGLANITVPYDLFITVADDGTEVRTAFPTAKIYAKQENRGMDIGGFFIVLPDLLAGKYDIVLKLHSKTDDRWRRILLGATCGSPRQVAMCLSLLQQPQVGAVGANDLIFRDGQGGKWKRNQCHIETLTRRYGMNLLPINFIGGTMFWIKMEPLRRVFYRTNMTRLLAELNTPTSFDWAWYRSFYRDLHHLRTKEEAISHWERLGRTQQRAVNGLQARARGLEPRTDGMLEHAYERFFALLLVNQGLYVKGVDLPRGNR